MSGFGLLQRPWPNVVQNCRAEPHVRQVGSVLWTKLVISETPKCTKTNFSGAPHPWTLPEIWVRPDPLAGGEGRWLPAPSPGPHTALDLGLRSLLEKTPPVKALCSLTSRRHQTENATVSRWRWQSLNLLLASVILMTIHCNRRLVYSNLSTCALRLGVEMSYYRTAEQNDQSIET